MAKFDTQTNLYECIDGFLLSFSSHIPTQRKFPENRYLNFRHPGGKTGTNSDFFALITYANLKNLICYD